VSDGFKLMIDVSRPMELMEKFPEQVMAGAEQGIQEGVLLLENAVKSNILAGRTGGFGAAVATGTLLGAVFSDIHGTPTSIVGTVAVAPPADQYALVVEEGRLPGRKMPPVGVLRIWMKIRHIPEKLEFVLRRSIGRKGFKGAHMFLNAFTEHRARVIEIIHARIAEAVARIGSA